MSHVVAMRTVCDGTKASGLHTHRHRRDPSKTSDRETKPFADGANSETLYKEFPSTSQGTLKGHTEKK